MFSSIVQQFDVPTNRLYALRDQLLKSGRRFTDLISANVNSQGIQFPENLFTSALSAARRKSQRYRPDPLGQMAARKAISRYYSQEHLKVAPEHLLITPGTSLSYWYSFKTLADPGEEILCPAPSYPLFDSIAGLCGIKLVSYPLRETGRWEIDFESLRSAITEKTKAIVLISPHNPTGAVASPEEVRQLAAIAIQKNLAIISDEVFSPFLFNSEHLPRPADTDAPLVLTLNGFSKMLALPGLKIGWIGVTGDLTLVRKTMHALEMMSDTFLPVNEAAQFAVPALLLKSKGFQVSYGEEVARQMKLATDLLKAKGRLSFLQPEGGFFLTLRLKAGLEEENVACRLLQRHGILVHPGYFYDMEGQHLVFSFVNRPAVLRKALKTIQEEILL